MSVIQDEFFIRSELYKIAIHTKKITDLLPKFESTQQYRVSKNQNNLIGNSNQHHISRWYSALLLFSLGHNVYTDWDMKYSCCARILLNLSYQAILK